MKHKCEYCHSVSNDDYIGNCSACGAPRRYEPEPFNPFISGYDKLSCATSFISTGNEYGDHTARSNALWQLRNLPDIRT